MVVLAVLLGLALLLTNELGAQTENRVALVVEFEDGTRITRCVAFTENEITGLDVLKRADNLEIVTGSRPSTAGAVCRINGQGCSAGDCLTCSSDYWSYWHGQDDGWTYANVGATGSRVRDGDIEGWRWGPGQGSPPSDVAFDDICVPPATSTPTATPQPTATPIPVATALPSPDVQFWADGERLAPGTCTLVHWVAENVESATLNGEPVGGGGFIQTCPCEDTSFTLDIRHRDGTTETRTLTVETEGTCGAASTSPLATPNRPVTATPRPPQPAPTLAPTSSPTVTPRAETTPTATPIPTRTRRPRRRTPTAAPSPSATPQPTASATAELGVQAMAVVPTDTPSPTPTRATVEGYDSQDRRPITETTAIPVTYLAFGMVLLVIGISYLFLVRHS